MQTRSFLLLMGLFALLARVPPAPAQRRRESSSSSSSSEEQPSFAAKKCPTNMQGRVRERGKMCLVDADCPRNEICCKYGSHQECLLPVGEHPGYCPKANPDPTTRCRFSCTTDKQCGRGTKCCRWGCTSRCTEAEPAHSGVCPEKNALQNVAPAGSNTCTDDRDCVSEQKCCFTRRGLRCTDLEEGLCELPVQPGSCTSSLRRYYYNSTARSCEAFKYSGCKGNANRFHTKEECVRVCGQPDFAHDLGAGSGGAALLRDDARPGLCPERKVLNVTAYCRNACEDDRDCSPHQKCYFSGCGHQCIDPERDICKFPAERGPCDAYIPMFHYSTSAKTCKRFIYGGCGGNANRFSTLEVCLWACRYQDICKLPMVRGHCDSHKITYYYNHTNKSCESFIYHGCEGNENRFRTLEACHSTCLYPEVCKLPMDPGPCRAYVPMYYYNPQNKSCVRFTYGGCQGNRNRFATLEQCEASCRHPDICVLPEEPGPCCNVTNMYHFSPAVRKCVPFPYGGCQGNANRFATMEDCMETCSSKDICKLPAEPGPCLGHIPQFYYNPVNKTCEKFVYGGCGGNDNRFKTQLECVWKCRNPDVCKLPEQPGPCDAAMLRYHYNAATKTCETFIYGGCQGNENNFETLAECEHACKTTYICRLPLNPGEGNDAIPMYYYDTVGKICEQFTYKGHKGNPNRFATLEECQEACRDPDICKLPRNPGPCDASVQRFYFHSNTRLCASFHYGGCKGNTNNFVTKEECQETCKGPEKPGSCPPGDSRHCLVTCQKDYECPGVKKCCSSSCGQVCLEPLKERPGGCPPVPPNASSACAENCRHDRDCPDQEKCCSNGCGHVCRKLVL